jgi:hypothetical protein
MVWSTEEAAQMQFRFVRLDGDGRTAADHLLDTPVRQPSQPKLWCDGAGGIHLFWLDSAAQQEPTLYHARIDARGTLTLPARQVLPPNTPVAGYAISQAIPEALDIFWSDSARPSAVLYHTRMSLSNLEVVRSTPLGVRGAMPAAMIDSRQQVHLAWYSTDPNQGDGIVYARFDPARDMLSRTTWVAGVPASTLYPPEIGLDWQQAYVFWSQERRGGGGGTPSAETGCRSISLGNPGDIRDCGLSLPLTDRPKYTPSEGELAYHSLAHIEDNGPEASSNYTYMPYPLPGQRQELAVVLSTRLVSRQGRGELQIVLSILRGGTLEGYQPAGQTHSASLRPIAVADDRGQIHLAWLDTAGFGRYRVYYASTDPQVKANINRLTFADILGAFAGRIWNTAAAFSFLPMLLVWLFPPLLVLVISYLIFPDRDMRTRSGRLWLGGAVVLYLAAKTLIVPSFLWYAPFLDLVPARLQDLLIFGLPGAIALGSFLLMRWFMRRFEHPEILYGFAVFAAIDATLSLVLYIPNVIA